MKDNCWADEIFFVLFKGLLTSLFNGDKISRPVYYNTITYKKNDSWGSNDDQTGRKNLVCYIGICTVKGGHPIHDHQKE